MVERSEDKQRWIRVNLPETFHRSVKIAAIQEGKTLKQWIIDAAKDCLESEKTEMLLEIVLRLVAPNPEDVSVEKQGPESFLLKWRDVSGEHEFIIQKGKRYKLEE